MAHSSPSSSVTFATSDPILDESDYHSLSSPPSPGGLPDEPYAIGSSSGRKASVSLQLFKETSGGTGLEDNSHPSGFSQRKRPGRGGGACLDLLPRDLKGKGRERDTQQEWDGEREAFVWEKPFSRSLSLDGLSPSATVRSASTSKGGTTTQPWPHAVSQAPSLSPIPVDPQATDTPNGRHLNTLSGLSISRPPSRGEDPLTVPRGYGGTLTGDTTSLRPSETLSLPQTRHDTQMTAGVSTSPDVDLPLSPASASGLPQITATISPSNPFRSKSIKIVSSVRPTSSGPSPPARSLSGLDIVSWHSTQDDRATISRIPAGSEARNVAGEDAEGLHHRNRRERRSEPGPDERPSRTPRDRLKDTLEKDSGREVREPRVFLYENGHDVARGVTDLDEDALEISEEEDQSHEGAAKYADEAEEEISADDYDEDDSNTEADEWLDQGSGNEVDEDGAVDYDYKLDIGTMPLPPEDRAVRSIYATKGREVAHPAQLSPRSRAGVEVESEPSPLGACYSSPGLDRGPAVILKPFTNQVGGHHHIFRFSRRAVCKVCNHLVGL